METPESEQGIVRMNAPVYDFPSQRSPCSMSAGGSPTTISVTDRLLLTKTIWLHLSVNSATALHILQREPPGTFLVRRSNTQQQMVLYVRLSDDRGPSFIHQTSIHEGPTGLSLEKSALSFPDLVKLVSHYCSDQDVLPYTLRLPKAIEKVTSRKQLEAISRLGLEFWSSSLNARDPSSLSASPSPSPPPPSIMIPSPVELPHNIMPDLLPSLKTRSPQEVSGGGAEGALCFFNPLFKSKHAGELKRSRFKKSVKVRVSTENSGSLSPPLNPPPPVPPEEAVKEEDEEVSPVVASQGSGDGQIQEVSEDQEYRRPRSSLRQRLRKSLSKGSMELGLKMSPSRSKDLGEYKVPAPITKTKEQREMVEPSSNGLHSLEEHDSGSISSVDEGTSEDGGKSSPQLTRRRKKRSGRSSFRAVSGAFLSLLSPERKILVTIEEMGRDVTREFGKELQEFLRKVGEREKKDGKEKETNEERECSYKTLLKEVRDFMDKMQNILRDTAELQLDALSPEEEDRVLEKSLHRLILKPLRSFLVCEVQRGLEATGDLERLGRNMQMVRKGGPVLLGVNLVAPGSQELEKIRHKLLRMQEKYSPCDKVRLLLQACQGVYRSMGSQQDDACGADEFLPALCYVLALCDLPQLLIHTHYTIELLSQDTLVGEGGYYLTSVSAALSVLDSLHTHPQDAGLSLSEWHRRRQGLPSLNDLQNFLRVAHQDPVNGCTTKTILLRPTQTVATLTQLCALKFKVPHPEEFGIFLHTGEERQLLPPDSQPQQIKTKLKEEGSSFYFCYQHLEDLEIPENGETQNVAHEL